MAGQTSSIGKLLLEIQVTGEGAITALKGQVAQAEAGFTKFNSKLMAVGATATVAYLAINQMARYIKEMAKEAIEAELVSTALTSALAGVGSTSEGVREELDKQADQLGKTTAFEDDTIVKTMALLATFGKTTNEIQTLVPFLIDLASKMSMNSGRVVDLETATRAYFKALDGQDRSLKQYGIVLSEVAKNTKDVALITKELQEIATGAGADFANTTAGQMEIYNNSLKNLKEAWGGFFVSVFKPAIEEITIMFQMMNKLQANKDIEKYFTQLEDFATSAQYFGTNDAVQALLDQAYAMRTVGTLTETALIGVIDRMRDLKKENGETVFNAEEIQKLQGMIIDLKVVNKLKEEKIALDEKEQQKLKTQKEAEEKARRDKIAQEELLKTTTLATTGSDPKEREVWTTNRLAQAVGGLGGAFESTKQPIIDVNALLITTDDILRNNILSNLEGLLNGEKMNGGKILINILKQITIELTRMLLKSITLKGLFMALGIISGGASKLMGAGGTIGTSGAGSIMGGGGNVEGIFNLSDITPTLSAPIEIAGPGKLSGGNNYTINITETMPVTSDYEKIKKAGEYIAMFDKLDKRGTI